ncbi:MAG: hypothetical protein K0R39_1803 [Symbiobacteriaceae bacterium]|jgi:hypothetical protein|nr:hypothetical protein [Symbiobacteriaceae bacterium]
MRLVHIIAGFLAAAMLVTACARPTPGPNPEPPSSSQAGTQQPTAPDPAKSGSQGSQTTPANSGPSASAGGTTPSSQTTTPPSPAQPKQAEVTVQYRYGDSWRTVTLLSSHLPPGAAELRLLFSKPVRPDEVEQALLAAQPAPIRGVLQWVDEHTLIWRISQMPPRIDFLLGDAHDKEGVSLPGGLTSLRAGEAPALVMVNLADGAETRISPLPPDILSADLTPDGKYLNLTVWKPGATRWDWVTTDRYLTLESQELKNGRVEGQQPRLPANLESWALSPSGHLVAGLRASAQGGLRDLVTADVVGARQQVAPGFVARAPGAGTAGVVWSADGARVGALAQSPASPDLSDLVTFTLADRSITALARDLPVPAGTARLAWSPDGRHMLAGTVLLNLETGARTQLPGTAETARGMWEPGGARLLYSAEDWGVTMLVDPATGEARELGRGLTVGWTEPGRIYLVRWPSSATRYMPLGH